MGGDPGPADGALGGQCASSFIRLCPSGRLPARQHMDIWMHPFSSYSVCMNPLIHMPFHPSKHSEPTHSMASCEGRGGLRGHGGRSMRVRLLLGLFRQWSNQACEGGCSLNCRSPTGVAQQWGRRGCPRRGDVTGGWLGGWAGAAQLMHWGPLTTFHFSVVGMHVCGGHALRSLGCRLVLDSLAHGLTCRPFGYRKHARHVNWAYMRCPAFRRGRAFQTSMLP